MSTIVKALLEAGIGNDVIDERPDGTVSVTREDGWHMTMGDDGTDEDGQAWWTAHFCNNENLSERTDSWTSPEAMATEAAEFAGRQTA